MISEALAYTTAKTVSTGMSFLIFALVARYYTPSDTKAIYFFSFALGFLIAAIRGFCNLAAGLDGGMRRARKLRTVIHVTGQVLILQAAALAVSVAVFRTHPISQGLVVAASLTVAIASYDSDLLRAALNRGPLFSVTFAFGGTISLLTLLLLRAKAIEVGCAAMLVQWAPAGLVNMYLYFRILRPRGRILAIVRRVQGPGVVGTLAVAVFDGAVLNAPFLLADRMGTTAGLDLSVATRIFVSSLSLVPLVMHWSNSRALGSLAARLGMAESRLFATMLLLSGLLGGLVLALLYVWVSGKRLSPLQYWLSVPLLATYCVYATRMRYDAIRVPPGRKVLVLATSLGVYVGLLAAAASFKGVGAAVIVALQAATLLGSGFLMARVRMLPEASTARSDK